MKIGFIGAGKVGFSLGKYFNENNINVVGYFSKNIASAKEAANFTNTNYYESLKNLIECSDIIIITTPDSQIGEVWQEVKKLSINNKVICHCSGSLSSKIFSNIEQLGAYGYSIHPMYAFSDKYNYHINLNQATITIEGSEKYLKYFSDLFSRLGNNVKIISKDNKSIYHAASVVVSNHVIGLVQFAVDLLGRCGFDNNEAIEALYPLMSNNILNIKNNGLINSLTGPVERNDVDTIKKHINNLNEEDRELYKLLTKRIIKIAKVKNIENDYSDLENMMGE